MSEVLRAGVSGLLVALLVMVAVSGRAETLRDPMQPPPGAGAVAPDAAMLEPGPDGPRWRLSWTLVDDSGRNMARLNDRLIRVGDELEGARVTAIERGSVTLNVAGDTVEVRRRRASGLQTHPAAKDGDT